MEREANRAAEQVMLDAELCGKPAQQGGPGGPPPRRRAEGSRGESLISNLHSSGRSLSGEDRSFFENRFGFDFSQVKIHAGEEAADSARRFGALAYTLGSHIVFGAGQYAPGSLRGRHLLAHELTHVVQQSGGLQPQGPQAPGISSAPDAGPQRFESYEHVQIGDSSGGPATPLILLDAHTRDLPNHADPVNTWPAQWQTYYAGLNAEQQRALTRGLTYGEMVALSGDMYANFEALNRAPLREIIDLIPLIRSRTASTEQFQAATGGRYLALAKENIGHFSNVPVGQRNRDLWRNLHIQAIAAARSGNANLAWALNASGDHYLTDAFSGGHLRTPRAALHARGTTGDVQSKILHDLDNQFGVDVANPRGDTWTAYGDEHLNDTADARNLALVQEAERLSQQDISNALSQRMSYPLPTATTAFAAERLIPTPVDPTRDRWTGRQDNPWVPGTPWGPTTDYQRERRSVAGRELPGIASDLTSDDDRVRDWINRMDTPALGRQSEADMTRMITTLLGGVVDGSDMAAIERLLGSITDASKMDHLRRVFEPQASSLTDIALRTRFRVALSRTP